MPDGPTTPSPPDSASREVLVVAPEPADWVKPTIAALAELGPVHVVAPWALPPSATRWTRAIAFAQRRRLDAASITAWFPGFSALELVLRAYTRGRAHRGYATRMMMRAAVDRAVALGLRRGNWPNARTVLAPSLAARRTLAAARARGLRGGLLEDLPDLARLSSTLDRSAAAYPDCPFLANHRPPRWAVVDQRCERELAHGVGVRGAFAWQRLAPRFEAQLFAIPRASGTPRPAGTPSSIPTSPTVLLAGPAVGRSGTMHLSALANRMPQVSFAVQATTPTEPAALLAHPRVHVASAAQLELNGVQAVLSLSPVECHPAAVRRAIERGVPVVGTVESLGQVAPGSVARVLPHDLDEMEAALGRALRSDPAKPRPWSPGRSLSGWIQDTGLASSTPSVRAHTRLAQP